MRDQRSPYSANPARCTSVRRATSIRDKRRVLGLQLALAAHSIRAFSQHDRPVLLMLDDGRPFHLDVADVKSGGNVARQSIFAEHRHAIENSVTVSREFTFSQHSCAGL